MNTDYMVQDIGIREKQYRRNINSKGDTRYYDDSCKTIREYAKEQNTVYDPMTNQILYGINSNMHVSGVSDRTCNQIDPILFTPRYICGAGAAGGNRCVRDVLASNPYSLNQSSKNPNSNSDIIENFVSNSNCNGCNVSGFVVFVLIVFMLIIMIYLKYNKNL